MQAQGQYELSVVHEVDGEDGHVDTLLMDGAGGVLDDFELDVDSLGGVQLIDRDFDIGDRGRRIQFKVYNDTVNEDFDVHTILIDHKNLGVKPL